MQPTTGTLLFFLLVLFMASWHLDDGANDNTMARAASVASLVDRGTLDITTIHEVTGDKALVDGRYYSDKAPLPTFFVLPFHALAVKLGLITAGKQGTLGSPLLRLGGFLCGSLPMALICTLLWCDLRVRRMQLPLNASLLATLPLFGSFLFVYSGSFYNHLPGALFALLAARAMQRDLFAWVGFWSGCAVLCESVLLAFPLLWGLQLLLQQRWRSIPWLVLGLIPAGIATLLHNHAVTGHALVFPNAFAANYQAMHSSYGFGTWQPQAWLHLLFTDYRGMFFYMPVLLLGLWSLPKRMLRAEWLKDPFVLPSLLIVLAFCTHATWWAGWTYGPRYLMAPALLLAYAILIRSKDTRLERWSIALLSGFGLLCAFGAKSTIWYSMPTGEMHPMLTEVWPRMVRGEWTPMQWPVLLGLSPGPASLIFVLLFAITLFLLVRLDRTIIRS